MRAQTVHVLDIQTPLEDSTQPILDSLEDSFTKAPAESLPILEQAIQDTQRSLTRLATNDHFLQALAQAFGDHFDALAAENLRQQWGSGNFQNLPQIDLRSSSEIAEARGAFSSDTHKIYLSENYLTRSAITSAAIADVLLEEIGHFVDSQINRIDSPGDEGAIFSAFAQGHSLTPLQLQQAQLENDQTIVTLDGKQITLERAPIYTGTNLNDLRTGLDQLLTTLQSAIESQVFSNGVPLLGDSLKGSANDAVKFVNQLKAAFDSEFAKLSSTPTPDDLKQALQTAASSLGILKDLQAVEAPDSLAFNLKLGKDPVTFNTPLATNIGLPNLGINVKGDAAASLGYSFNFGFGLDKTKGFFLDTSISDPLDLKLGITTPGLDPKVNLGFLQFNATDKGTKFDGDFKIKLKDLDSDNQLFLPELATIGTNYKDLLDAKLTGGADVKFGLSASTGIKGLPAIGTDFGLKWNFNNAIADPTQPQSFGDAPQISFSNATLDLGAFISDFAGPILKDIQSVTGPLNDVARELKTPLPIINSSLIDLAQFVADSGLFGGGTVDPGTVEFVNQILGVIDLVNKIPTSPDGLKLELGDFSLGSADLRSTLASSATATPTKLVDAIAAQITAKAGGSQSASFVQTLQNPGDPKNAPTFKFDILESPNKAIGLLLGQDIGSLFSFTPPQLGFTFNYSPPAIPVFGPVVIRFGGSAGARAGIQFGYDSTGFQAFKASDFTQPDLLFDGFYASKPEGGNNLSLTGQIDASAGVGIGIADITVGGGLRLTSNLDLVGKVRASTIATTDPLCLFEPNGRLSVIIFGQLTLDFGFFSFTQRLDLADIALIDYDIPCDSSEPHYDVADPAPDAATQAQLIAQGIITRKGTTGNDTITFEKLGGGQGNERLKLIGLVAANGETNDYDGVKLVVLKGGDGNDTIDLTGILSPGQLKGGVGNDIIIGSDGGSNFLTGDAGNDNLDGGKGSNNTVDYSSSPNGVTVNLRSGFASDGFGGTDTLKNLQHAIGSSKNDTLIASDLKAVLQGGAGDDRLFGGAGDDVLLGGLGADFMEGRGGLNTTTYLPSRAAVYVNLSSTTVGDDFPVILPIDASPFYLNARRGSGGDAEGDRLSNVQNIQGSIFDDVLIAGDAGSSKSANGFTFTGSYLDSSDGDDIVYSGSGSDVLDGGRGENWVSYALSNSGVTVSLKPIAFFGSFFAPTGSGGFAQGDRLLPAKNQYNDNKGTFTQFSSFRNLEGSNQGDALTGDDGDNIIRGLAGSDTINAEGGNDTLVGGAGADSLNGGGFSGSLRSLLSSLAIANNGQGGDTASYEDSPGNVFVSLAANLGLFNDAQGDTFNSIQNLIGSRFGDVLIGDAQNNDLNPGLSSGSTDVVNGGGGTNSLTLDYSLGDYGRGMTGGFTNLATGSGSISRSTSNGSNGLDAVSFTNIQRLFLIATSRDDSITGGTNLSGDVVFAGAGNDFVNGGSGIDYLDGGENVDTLSDDLSDKNGQGNLTLIGTDPANPIAFSGFNVSLSDGTRIANFEIFKDINTADGNDTIVQPGRIDNIFNTGFGNDTVNPGLGFDTVDGGFNSASGISFVSNGTFEDDVLILDYSQGDTGGRMRMTVNSNGQTGIAFRYTTDFFVGDGTPPLLDRVNFSNFERYNITGTRNADEIAGGNGDDILIGGAGNDLINAGFSDDQLFGQGDDDTLIGGQGNDFLSGGDGNDQLFGDDLLIGGQGNDFVGGRDQLFGGAGNDRLYGGGGSDQLFGQANDDILIGGQGNDFLDGGDGNDQLFGDTDLLIGGQGNDFFGGDDRLEGGAGNDQLFGNAGNDQLLGQADDDILIGGQGNDFLDGGSGNDILIGLTGANTGSNLTFGTTFSTGGDIDTLTGGTGADTFVIGDFSNVFYANIGDSDYALITDFNPTEGDTIQLHNLGDNELNYSVRQTPESLPNGSALYVGRELIAIVQGPFASSNPLDLKASYFQYVGSSPPPIA
jgi:Ca2+-binding RTX toxin-like protein